MTPTSGKSRVTLRLEPHLEESERAAPAPLSWRGGPAGQKTGGLKLQLELAVKTAVRHQCPSLQAGCTAAANQQISESSGSAKLATPACGSPKLAVLPLSHQPGSSRWSLWSAVPQPARLPPDRPTCGVWVYTIGALAPTFASMDPPTGWDGGHPLAHLASLASQPASHGSTCHLPLA